MDLDKLLADEETRQENARKKEYLNRYRRACERCRDIELEVTRLRLDKMLPSVLYDDMPHSHDCSDLSGYAARIDEIIERLKSERYKKINIRIDIERRIDQIADESEREVLRQRYIAPRRKSWDEIADSMGYSRRWTLRLHGRALIDFQIGHC